MNNHLTDAQLQDHADGLLAPTEVPAANAHLEQCATCREGLAKVEALLRAAAGTPRTISPPEDLWPSIRRRIDDSKVAIIGGGSAVAPPSKPWWNRPAPAVAAAAALVLISAAVTAVLVTPATPIGPVSIDGAVVSAPAGAPQEVVLLLANYQGLSHRLSQDFATMRHRLPPAAVAAVEANLGVIDSALAEIQAVMDREPDNGTLLELLASTYRQRVSVLEHATESVS